MSKTFADYEKVMGTEKDNSQYLKLKYKNISLIHETSAGIKYNIELKGESTITNYQGVSVNTATVLEDYITSGRESELNHDSIAYFSVSPESKQDSIIDVFYSLADVKSFVESNLF